MEFKKNCPAGCSSTFASPRRGRQSITTDHRAQIRTCIVKKMNECFELHNDPSLGEAATLRIIKQKDIFWYPLYFDNILTIQDNPGRPYNISHHCYGLANKMITTVSYIFLSFSRYQSAQQQRSEKSPYIWHCCQGAATLDKIPAGEPAILSGLNE